MYNDKLEGAMPNEPQSSDFMVLDYAGIPTDNAGTPPAPLPDWPLDANGNLHEPPPVSRYPRIEQALKLNMMTGRQRLADVYGTAEEKGPGDSMPADMVNLPPHYARFKIEPIRFIGENKLDWFQGNIIKYVTRWDAKNGLEDIAKVIRYANMYHRYIAGDPDWWKAGHEEDFKS